MKGERRNVLEKPKETTMWELDFQSKKVLYPLLTVVVISSSVTTFSVSTTEM